MLGQSGKITILLLLILALLLAACDPATSEPPPPTDLLTPTPPEPDHRVRRLSPQVNAGPPPTPPALINNDWLGLFSGDVITTDSDGEAELQLASCTGSIYVFTNSAIRASACPESELTSGLSTCSANGTGYFNIECTDEFIVDTAAAQVLVTGTTFAVTHLRENDLTLVIALEGSVQIRPVVEPETKELGASLALQGGEFLYTTPGENSREIDGISARSPRPIEEIGPLVNQFGLQKWMAQVEARAERDDLLPANWPLEDGEVVFQEETTESSSDNPVGLPPSGSISMAFLYGAFEDERVKSALVFGLNKDFALRIAYPNENPQIFANLDGNLVQINSIEYSPERALEILAESGYADGITDLVIFIPNSENSLVPFAEAFVSNLADIGIGARIQFFTLLELDFIIEENQELDNPTIILRKPD